MKNGGESFEKIVSSETPPEDALVLAAELKKHLAVIDLHGLSSREAVHRLEAFIHQKQQEGEESIRIVFGIGEGKLRAVVSNWLQEQKTHGQIQSYRFSDRDASVVAVLDTNILNYQ